MQLSSLTKYILAIGMIACVCILLVFAVKNGKENQDAMRLSNAISVGLDSPILAPTPEIQQTASPIPLLPLLDIHAENYFVQLIGSETPLAEKQADILVRPASITKILTSLIAAEELDAGSPIVFSSHAKAIGEKESSVPPGQVFSRDDTIRFAMVESANDAALALAEAVGRLRGAFSFEDAMSLFLISANKRAADIGMDHSHFENATGLDSEYHLVTAGDLFRLVRYIWEHHREIWDFSRLSEISVRSFQGAIYHATATNQLLSEFPALRGGKTGMTDQQKGALILLYPVKPDRTAVIIILGSDDRFGDGRKFINWLEDSFNAL